MNEENGSSLEFDAEEFEESLEDSLGNAQSRARNRTVMLTPEMTGEVRSLLKSDASSGVDDDFLRPGQLSQSSESSAEKVVIPPMVTPERITGAMGANGLGLNFGRSTNRAETTRFSREELDRALAVPSTVVSGLDDTAVTVTSAPSIDEVLVEEKKSLAFDPLTTLAPANGSAFLKPQMPIHKKPVQRKPAPRASVQAPLYDSVPKLNTNIDVNPSAEIQAPVIQAPVNNVVQTVSKPTSKIVGFLVSYDENEHGEVFEIRAGRKLVTSRPTDHGEYMLIDDKTVSPLHAILRATKDGKVQVLDQLSEHGTAVVRSGEDEELEITGGLEEVYDGDTVRFGSRNFEVCLITKS